MHGSNDGRKGGGIKSNRKEEREEKRTKVLAVGMRAEGKNGSTDSKEKGRGEGRKDRSTDGGKKKEKVKV